MIRGRTRPPRTLRRRHCDRGACATSCREPLSNHTNTGPPCRNVPCRLMSSGAQHAGSILTGGAKVTPVSIRLGTPSRKTESWSAPSGATVLPASSIRWRTAFAVECASAANQECGRESQSPWAGRAGQPRAGNRRIPTSRHRSMAAHAPSAQSEGRHDVGANETNRQCLASAPSNPSSVA